NKRFGLYGIAFAVILAFFFWFSSRKLFIAEITPLIAIPLAVIATAISGMALERIAYKPLRNSPRLAPLISAIGASLFYQNLAQIIFGTHRYSLPMAVKISNAKILGSNFALAPVLIILSAVVIMIALHLFIAKTRIGTAMRATAQDKYAASLMGINVNAVIAMTFAIGSALAAVGGLLFTIHQKTLWPYMGFMAGIKAFTAAVLGGIGSIPGAMLGGFILGIVESLGAGLFGEAGYKDAIAFVILIGVLLFKPTGILGKRSVIKV
ncbi:TPA: branched-chain amino acid ABC transporter permease, partial [bacterium]|nr:branched-chain amino acid ABC transporter permease [bacterium]